MFEASFDRVMELEEMVEPMQQGRMHEVIAKNCNSNELSDTYEKIALNFNHDTNIVLMALTKVLQTCNVKKCGNYCLGFGTSCC